MKLIETKCPSCGAEMSVDANRSQVFCSFCGSKLLIDHEKIHVVYDNAGDSGYEFEKGRQRAQAELEQKKLKAQEEERKKIIRQQQEQQEKAAFFAKKAKERNKTIIWGNLFGIAVLLFIFGLLKQKGYCGMSFMLSICTAIIFLLIDIKKFIIFFKSRRNVGFNKSLFAKQNRFLMRISFSGILALFDLIVILFV